MSRPARRTETVASVARGFFAVVWIVNGLWCKLLGGVPRHREIVERVLGGEHALLLTRLIGAAELVMAFWILSDVLRRRAALAQIVVVLLMNVIEFVLAPDLLLFGRANLLVAVAFVALVAAVEFRPGAFASRHARAANDVR